MFMGVPIAQLARAVGHYDCGPDFESIHNCVEYEMKRLTLAK